MMIIFKYMESNGKYTVYILIIDQFDTIFNQELRGSELLVVNLYIQELCRNNFVFLGGLRSRWLTG